MAETILTALMTGRLVKDLEAKVPDFAQIFDAIQRSASPALQYPDGSLESDAHPETNQLRGDLMPRKRLNLSVTSIGSFRSLPPFQPSPQIRQHRLWSVEEHEKRVAPGGVLCFAPAIMDDDYPTSNDLEKLHLNMLFHRRISRELMARLGRTVCEWQASVSQSGMFGEGPVGRLSPEMEFQGRRAGFWFDASRTGQRTVNWLILSLLNALYDFARPDAFVFNDVERLARYGFGPDDGTTTRLSHHDPAGCDPAVIDPEIDRSRLPSGLIPIPEFGGESFTAWRTPSFEWESFQLAIYLEAAPDRHQRADLDKILKSWSFLGRCGGFGGEGFKTLSDPVALRKLQAVYVEGDFGEADPDLAMPVLLRALQNFASGTLGIEAIVFGLNPASGIVI